MMSHVAEILKKQFSVIIQFLGLFQSRNLKILIVAGLPYVKGRVGDPTHFLFKQTSLDKVFDPFFTTKASGTGLGLSIVQTIVRGHGGEITLESAKDKGAAFSMSLPIAAEQGN